MEKVKANLLRLWKLTGSLPYLRLVILGGILVLSVVVFYKCGSSPSQNEIDLKKNTGEVIETQANTRVAEKEVEKGEADVEATKHKARSAREVANKAVKAAEDKKNDSTGNVTYEHANRARCTAYPGDKECQ